MYGFNGKENDNEVKGEGNQQDYGMRIYDNRLGRFLSVDPITKTYPMLTPYQFASNTPIYAIDFDGLEMMNPRAMEAGLNYIETKTGMEAMKGNKAAQEAYSTMLSTKFKSGALQLGIGSMGGFGFFGTTATLTNLTARATTLYTTYSVAAANVGAFTIELLNPDPNGTPGLEFTQGDEIARGLKLLFKQSAVPLVKPIEKFILNTSKFDYFFGKLDYQNLKGADLDAYAKNVGRTVESLIHNQDRASSMAKVFDAWGIKDTQAGFGKLSELFSAGLNAKELSSKTNEFGTTVTRELSLVYSAGEKKGQSAGSMLISYFYKGGDMNSTPEITTVIPKLAQNP
jgi:RHS repeat-associated protein